MPLRSVVCIVGVGSIRLRCSVVVFRWLVFGTYPTGTAQTLTVSFEQ